MITSKKVVREIGAKPLISCRFIEAMARQFVFKDL